MSSQTHVFHMEMTCGGCANAATKVLKKLGDGVTDIDANPETKKVTVTSTLSAQELEEALKKTGKAVNYKGLKQ